MCYDTPTKDFRLKLEKDNLLAEANVQDSHKRCRE